MDLTQARLHALLAAFSEPSEGEEKNSTLPCNGQGFFYGALAVQSPMGAYGLPVVPVALGSSLDCVRCCSNSVLPWEAARSADLICQEQARERERLFSVVRNRTLTGAL